MHLSKSKENDYGEWKNKTLWVFAEVKIKMKIKQTEVIHISFIYITHWYNVISHGNS